MHNYNKSNNKLIFSLVLLISLVFCSFVRAQMIGPSTGAANSCKQRTAAANAFLTSAGPNTSAQVPNLTGDCSGPITNTIAATLHLNGTNVTGVATYAMSNTDVVVAVDASSQSVTVTLPPNLGGQVTPDSFIIKTDSSVNTVTITPFSGDTVNGSASSIVIAGQGNALKTFPVNPQQWFAQEQGTATVQTVVAASGAVNWANSGSTYMLLGSALAVQGTETALPIPWSRAGLWSNLYCKVSGGALTSTMTFTVTLKSCTPSSGTCSTSASNLACVISSSGNGGLTCSDTSNSLITAAGDLIDMAATAANTPTAQPGRCTIQFFPF